MVAFAGVSPWPAQRLLLAVLGWARDNPSSAICRWFPAIRVWPAALRGQAVTVNPTDLGQLISFEEIFVESVYELSRVPFTPTAIVDCGAHVGFFSVLGLSTYPQVPVTVFEPNPVNLGPLRRNLAAFGGQAFIHAAAVSTHDGSQRFSAVESNAGRLAEPGESGTEVPVIDLTRFVSGDSGSALLVKIDIEGEERRLVPHVLPVLPRRCAVFLETHDGAESRNALIEQMVSHGFAVSELRVREPYADLFALREGA